MDQDTPAYPSFHRRAHIRVTSGAGIEFNDTELKSERRADACRANRPTTNQVYAVSADGQRVLVNWTSEGAP
jgi:hypothetical protein